MFGSPAWKLGAPYTIASERSFLRPFAPDDLAAFSTMAGDAATMRHIGSGACWDIEEQEIFLLTKAEEWAARGFGMGALCDLETGGLVGMSGLQPLGTSGEIEIGWWLRESERGRGRAREVGEVLLAWAGDSLPLDRVLAVVQPANTASKGVASAIGMRFVGISTSDAFGMRTSGVELEVYEHRTH